MGKDLDNAGLGKELGDLFSSFFNDALKLKLDEFKEQSPEEVLTYIRNKYMKSVVPDYKDSDKVTERYLYDITILEDTRLMIILANIYLEICVEEILKSELENPQSLQNFGYLYKLNVLNAIGLVTGDLYEDMILVNNWRNKFAHDVKFKIDKIQLKRISDLKNYKLKLPFKKRDEIDEYFHYITSLLLFQLIHRLGDKFEILDEMSII